MRRRRHQLQVSTFPFLAVLLCAMGSLILLLLVIDRRAKEAERDKVLNAYRRDAVEQERLVAARKAELERQSRELHARLLHENESVVTQVHAADAELTAALSRLEDAKRAYHDAQTAATSASQKLLQDRDEIGMRHARIVKAAEAAAASQKDLARLAAELHELEQMVVDLKLARQRQSQTFSLMPYRGRQGDDRQPLYIECTGKGYIFHPDRLVLQLRRSLVSDIRSEVQRRIARLQATPRAAVKKPYILLLVRPNGIESYYVLMRALDGLDLDFGYEFVEQGWVLDFQNEDVLGQQPWMAEAVPAAPPRSDLKPLRLSKTGRASLVGVYPLPPSGGNGSGGSYPGAQSEAGGSGNGTTAVKGNGGRPGTGANGTATAVSANANTAGQGSGGGSSGSGSGGAAAVLGKSSPPGQGSGGRLGALASAHGIGGGFVMAPLENGPAGSASDRNNGPLASALWRPGRSSDRGGTSNGSGSGSGPGGPGGGQPAATLGAPVGAFPGGGSGLGSGNAVASAGSTGQPGVPGSGGQGQGNGWGGVGGPNPGGSPFGGATGTGSATGGNTRFGVPGQTGSGAPSGASHVAGATGSDPITGSTAPGANGTGTGQSGTGFAGTTGSGPGGVLGTPGSLTSSTGPPGTGASAATASAYQGVASSPNALGVGTGSLGRPGTTAGNGTALSGAGAASTTTGTGTGGSGGANGSATGSNQQGGAPGTAPVSSNGTPNDPNANPSPPGQSTGGESGSSGGGGSGSSGGSSDGSSGGGATGGSSGGAPAPTAPGAPAVSSDPSAPAEPNIGGPSGSAASGSGQGAPPTQFTEPLPGVVPRRPGRRPAVVQPALLNINRDWIVGLECRGTEVVIYPGRKSFSVTALEDPAAGQALATTLRTLIDHRQASVPPGQAPYRPLLRFLVWPNGLRAYYGAYPLLETLRIPMGRVDVHSQDELRRALYSGS